MDESKEEELPQSDDPQVLALASAAWSAALLRQQIQTRHEYGNIPTDATAIDMHHQLSEAIAESLRDSSSDDLLELYKQPHFENTSDTNNLLYLFTAIVIRLAERLNMSPERAKDVIIFAKTRADDKVQQLGAKLQEIMVFECRMPLARANQAYGSRERAFFMLGQYWDFYRALLSYQGDAMVGWTPHPMLRFIVNTRARIRQCLGLIEDHDLAEAIDQALEIEFDLDANTLWDDFLQPRVARASEAYEEARLRIHSTSFDLTEPERLFLESAHSQLKELDKETRNAMNRLIHGVKKARPDLLDSAAKPSASCFDWIRRAEHALRSLIVDQAKKTDPNRWPEEVERLLGKDAVSMGLATMQQRSIHDLTQIIHYTNLSDVVTSIANRYELFANRIGLKRREFNKLTAPILKGRTEEAHNRPEHLWPEIEKQRVMVACYDLLSALEVHK